MNHPDAETQLTVVQAGNLAEGLDKALREGRGVFVEIGGVLMKCFPTGFFRPALTTEPYIVKPKK